MFIDVEGTGIGISTLQLSLEPDKTSAAICDPHCLTPFAPNLAAQAQPHGYRHSRTLSAKGSNAVRAFQVNVHFAGKIEHNQTGAHWDGII